MRTNEIIYLTGVAWAIFNLLFAVYFLVKYFLIDKKRGDCEIEP